jgi:hypothetical protein
VLGGVLDRDATLRDATLAGELRDLLAADAAVAAPAAVIAALDALYPCP